MNLLLEKLAAYRLVLASGSPRRKELLNGLGLRFFVILPPEVDESYPPQLKGEAVASYICSQKANAFKPLMLPDDLVITADTIVSCDGVVYGKPSNQQEAVCMLRALSGKTHQVFTGVSIMSSAKRTAFVAKTDVHFCALNDREIDWYVETYRPYDKAGAYGVQEWIGYVAVESITGSYYNVMGLPVHQLYKALIDF